MPKQKLTGTTKIHGASNLFLVDADGVVVDGNVATPWSTRPCSGRDHAAKDEFFQGDAVK